jgi:hypothetical protein
MGSSSATWRMDNISLFGNVIAITTPILQSATISSNATSVCAGTDVIFTSTSTNTWSSATYQWQLNNADISGATSSSYTSANLANLDVVRLLVSTSLGCIANSIFTSSGIEISVNNGSTNLTSQTACGSYLWNGTTYSTSGVYTGSTTNCVTETLNLTINPSSINSTSQSACDSYVWNGTTYNTSGVYTGETVNCVTESLNLTITPSSTNITTTSAVGTYTWANNDQTYTSSGVYSGNTINCETQVLNLTITPLSATLSLQVFLDGYYINSSNPSSMRPARYNNLLASGSTNTGSTTDVDIITVELRSTSNIDVVAYSVSPILQANGTAQCVFPPAALGGSFYIVVKHRAAIPLWSANPLTLSASSAFNFANNSTNAFSDGDLILKDIIPPIIKSTIVDIKLSDYKNENDLCSHAHDILTQHINKVKTEIVVHTIVLRFIHTLLND